MNCMQVYFDNAATTYPKPETVYQAVNRFMHQVGASPGRSAHQRGREASRIVSETRELLAKLFNVKESTHIIFTASATEAINLGLKGLLKAGDHVVTTRVEHNAVLRPLMRLRDEGVEVTFVPCSVEGFLDPQDVESALRADTRLIVVNHASNVVGTIAPLAQIGRIARQNGALFMVDAAQTAGSCPLDVEASGIDLLAFSGHKGLLGPPGTGGLYIRKGLNLMPLKEGGTGRRSEDEQQPNIMPERYESGTLNAWGLAGLGAGVRFINQVGLETIRAHEEQLTARLIQGLSAIEGLILYGPADAARQTATVSFNLESKPPLEVGYILDEVYGVAVRIGLHCAPLAHKTVGSLPRGGTVRMSLSYANTLDEVEYAIECVSQIAR